MKSVAITFSPEGQPVVVRDASPEEITKAVTGRSIRKPTQEEVETLYPKFNAILGRGATTRREAGRVMRLKTES